MEIKGMCATVVLWSGDDHEAFFDGRSGKMHG